MPFDGSPAEGVAGELALCRDGRIAVCTGGPVPDAVRLAVIDYRPEAEILEALGDGDVSMGLWLERSERRQSILGGLPPGRP